MRFGPTRQHISFIFENFLKDSFFLIVALVVAIGTNDTDEIISELIIGGAILLGPVFRIIAYYVTLISVENDMLIVKSGLLNKVRKEMPISGITTINLTQSIFHQAFGAYRMIINNSSNISEDAEINITLSKAKALELRSILTSEAGIIDGAKASVARVSEEDLPQGAKVFTVSTAQLMLYGALRSKGATVLKILGAMLAFIGFFGELFDKAFEKIINVITEQLAITDVSDVGVVATLVLIAIGIISSILFGAVGALLQYYDFRIVDYGRELHINYGIITKKNYKFDKSKIAGISYEQPLLMRMAGIGMLKCIAVGYGWGDSDVSQEDPMLLPLAKSSEYESIMSSFISELGKKSPVTKPEIKSAYYFLYRPINILTIVLAIAACIAANMIHSAFYAAAALVLLLGFIDICMQFNNSSISSNEDNVRISRGGFTKTTDCIRTDYIESVTDTATIWKRRKGIAHIMIGYFAKGGHAIAVNVSSAAADELLRYVDF